MACSDGTTSVTLSSICYLVPSNQVTLVYLSNETDTDTNEFEINFLLVQKESTLNPLSHGNLSYGSEEKVLGPTTVIR